MLRQLLLLSIILFIVKPDTTTTSNSFKPFTDNSYTLTWNVDKAAGLINMTLDCATTGWVGIGLSDTGMMANSDLNICYITKDSVPTCIDGFANGYSFSKDEASGGTNDISKVTGSVTNGRTVISFSKKLNSGDTHDKAITQGAEMKVLFSYRTEGNPSTENGQFNVHSAKIMKSIILWPSDGVTSTTAQSYKYDAGEKVMSMGVTRLSLSAQKTYYACKYFNVKALVQNLTQKTAGLTYHAVAFEPQIDNSKRLHHFVIYSCTDPSKVTYSDQAYDCTNQATADNCRNIILGWAPGSDNIVMPKEAGMVWGSYDTEAVMLQIHYNNEDLAAGELDSSAINVFLTTNLRQFDVGLMTVGKLQQIFSIPAGQKAYDVKASCTAACTSTSKGSITVFGYTPHGHMLMTKLYTDITTAGRAVVTLKEDPFDFHMQRFIQPSTPITLNPGFQATTTCTYDSSARTTVTNGGLGSDNEMCYNFVMYYPKENGLYWCIDADVGMQHGCIPNEKVSRLIDGGYMTYSYLLLLVIGLLI
jgi:hypothetical protein